MKSRAVVPSIAPPLTAAKIGNLLRGTTCVLLLITAQNNEKYSGGLNHSDFLNTPALAPYVYNSTRTRFSDQPQHERREHASSCFHSKLNWKPILCIISNYAFCLSLTFSEKDLLKVWPSTGPRIRRLRFVSMC